MLSLVLGGRLILEIKTKRWCYDDRLFWVPRKAVFTTHNRLSRSAGEAIVDGKTIWNKKTDERAGDGQLSLSSLGKNNGFKGLNGLI